jgi:predicted flap endonuclease-1-like 5' DNA nuclease
MDGERFAQFLKRSGRSPSATARCVRCAAEFEAYLEAQCRGKSLQAAGPEDLEAFVTWLEEAPNASAKTHLWALHHYYDYVSDDAMCSLAGALREERIERTPFPLAKFPGVDPEYVVRLQAAGVKNVAQMLKAGETPKQRQALAEKTGVPIDAMIGFLKLSDLARIPGIKGVRARLYHDAGVDTIEKLACWEPEKLRAMLVGFVEETGFEGIAPLPKEVAFSVARARRLAKIVEYW